MAAGRLGTAAVADPVAALVAVLSANVPGSDAWLKLHAGGNLEALIVGPVTRDANGAATSAAVLWPDAIAGTYVGTPSAAWPGAIDSYAVTWAGSTTKTVTQSAVTRDSNGAVTNRPAMTVS